MGGADSARERVFTSGADVPGSVGPGADAPRGGEHASSLRHLTFCLLLLSSVRRFSSSQTLPVALADALADSRPMPGRGRCLPQMAAECDLGPKAKQLRFGVPGTRNVDLQVWGSKARRGAAVARQQEGC